MLERFGRITLALEEQPQGFDDVALVVRYEDSRGSGWHSV
jgi:hypothetical protein